MTTQQNNDNGHNDYLGSWRQQNEKNEKKKIIKNVLTLSLGLQPKLGQNKWEMGQK
jgi:hypothetical protein